MSDRCKSCPAVVRWVVMAKTGKRMLIDAKPSASGTIVLQEDGTAEVDFQPGRVKYTSHFATCPAAKAHRVKR